ncbi:MAG: PaaI family thioesterase [Oscillospiraceae bacterium]
MPELEKIKELFQNDRFATGIGCEIEAYDDGKSVIGITILPEHLNAAGTVQGGVIATLADFAFAVAANGSGEWIVTLSSSMSYFKGVSDGRLTARARRITQNHRTCYYDIDVTEQTSVLVAKMVVTGYRCAKPLELR